MNDFHEPHSPIIIRHEQVPTQKPAWSKPGKLAALVAGLLVLLVVSVGALVHWKKSTQIAATKAPVRDAPYLDGSTIRFSTDFAKRAGIKTSPAVIGEIVPTVTVTGTVRFDPKLVAAIGARINGRVRRIHRVPGDLVNAGDDLAELESAELGQAQSAVLTARAHAQAAIANEKRERGLADAKVSSERDAELAHAQADSARAEYNAATQAVKALGGGGVGNELGVLVLRSPIKGKVVESSIFIGQSLEPSFTAFKVADLTRLWVELAVYERELTTIRMGDTVDLAPQIDRNTVEHGTVAYVGDVIDEDTHSGTVRIEVDNTKGSLRHGQSVVAKIHTRAPAMNVLYIPVSAVTRIDGTPTVFVAASETQVESRKVELGLSDGVKQQAVSGLSAGDLVITEGVFAIKSELFR